ncbi:MAG: hypothetical protein F4W68_07325 [Cenarchaeum sp. SB0661_bin_35]|nr:hypothetical protein [Cenarchaeum sp. SB0661_bin_35]
MQGQEIRHAQDVTVQQLQIKRLEDEIKRLELRLGAHENRNKPGDNPYNNLFSGGYINNTIMLPYNIWHHEFHLKGRQVNTDRVHNSD